MPTPFALGYDSLNFSDLSTSVVDYSPDEYADAPQQHVAVPYGLAPGGVLSLRPPGLRTRPYGGSWRVSVGNGAFEQQRDTWRKALQVPRRRLYTSILGDRYCIATPTQFNARAIGPGQAQWTATFVSEDPYDSAIAPSGDSRTPTLALLPGETTAYGVSYALTPGGTAPAPVRVLVCNQSGGVTPVQVLLTNLTSARGLVTGASLPALSLLVLDPANGLSVAPTTNIAGYWPLAESAGNPLDLSGRSRDLTANGALSYLQDGPQNGVALGFPGATTAYLSRTDAALGFTADFSVGAWVYATSLPATRAVVLSKASANAGYSLQLTPTGFAFAWGNATTNATITGTTQPVAGGWYFVAASYSPSGTSNRARLYVGTEYQPPRLEAQAAAAPNISASASDFRLGAGHGIDGTVYPLTGRIADPWLGTAEYALTTQLLAMWKRGPWAAYDAAQGWVGQAPLLDPAYGATNTLQLRADSGAGIPTLRTAAVWRSRYG